MSYACCPHCAHPAILTRPSSPASVLQNQHKSNTQLHYTGNKLLSRLGGCHCCTVWGRILTVYESADPLCHEWSCAVAHQLKAWVGVLQQRERGVVQSLGMVTVSVTASLHPAGTAWRKSYQTWDTLPCKRAHTIPKVMLWIWRREETRKRAEGAKSPGCSRIGLEEKAFRISGRGDIFC